MKANFDYKKMPLVYAAWSNKYKNGTLAIVLN